MYEISNTLHIYYYILLYMYRWCFRLFNTKFNNIYIVSVGFISGEIRVPREINEFAANCCASLYHIKHFLCRNWDTWRKPLTNPKLLTNKGNLKKIASFLYIAIYFGFCIGGDTFNFRKQGILSTFIADLHSGKLHREFHHGPDPTTTTTEEPGVSRHKTFILF